MNIFDINKFQPGQEFQITQQQQNPQQQPAPNSELPIENVVNDYLKFNRNKAFDGNLLNDSDTELLNNQLERYLPSASLRLEIQMERISKSMHETTDHLKALALLPDSDDKINQQKILLAKRQSQLEVLNHYKDQYRKLGPLHQCALWLKDNMGKAKNVGGNFKKLLYGKQMAYLNSLNNAKTSIELLSNQLQGLQNLPGRDETSLNIVDIIKQYDKINQEISTAQDTYQASLPPDLLNIAKKKAQTIFYGSEIKGKK